MYLVSTDRCGKASSRSNSKHAPHVLFAKPSRNLLGFWQTLTVFSKGRNRYDYLSFGTLKLVHPASFDGCKLPRSPCLHATVSVMGSLTCPQVNIGSIVLASQRCVAILQNLGEVNAIYSTHGHVRIFQQLPQHTSPRVKRKHYNAATGEEFSKKQQLVHKSHLGLI